MTDFNTLLHFKITGSPIARNQNNQPVDTVPVNNITIDARTKQIFEPKYHLRNTDAILIPTESIKYFKRHRERPQ